MAFTNFDNKLGVTVSPVVGYPNIINSMTPIQLNAVGKSVSYIGRIFIEGGSGTKTFSGAGGGKIVWANVSGITWANASTTVRVGIQDYDAATGFEDTNWDVYKDLVPGTDTVTGTAIQTTTMANGSKSITHGDMIVVVIEMTARGGTDSLQVGITNDANYFPYCALDTGSGPTRFAVGPVAHIIFDDGSYGWFPSFHACQLTDVVLNTGTTPDEVALVFQLPFAAELTEMFAHVAGVATTDNWELILYTTPTTSPVAAYTESFTGFRIGTTSGSTDRPVRAILTTPYTLLANTTYAIAVRPTTANSINLKYVNFTNANDRKMTTLGTNWYYASRSDQTGAFSSTTTRLPYMGFNFKSIENTSGGSCVFA